MSENQDNSPGKPQQTIQIIAKINQVVDPANQPAIRVDFCVLGDARPAGFPEWKAGELETGPNYHSVVQVSGQLPAAGVDRAFTDALGVEVREFVQARLRRMYGA